MAAFMDEVVIDPISGEQLTPQHAILVPMIDGITNVLDYVKSVGDIIGTRNIRSAYCLNKKVKIYLRFQHHVEEIINSGINLLGKFAAVEYSEPPSAQITLRNVDTEIPNLALTKKLSEFGKVVSKVKTLKLPVDDAELSRIETDVRLVSVEINPMTPIPKKLQLTHCRVEYTVDVSLEPPESDKLLFCCTNDITHGLPSQSAGGSNTINSSASDDANHGQYGISVYNSYRSRNLTNNKRAYAATECFRNVQSSLKLKAKRGRPRVLPEAPSTSTRYGSVKQATYTSTSSSPFDLMNGDIQESRETSISVFGKNKDDNGSETSSKFSIEEQKFVLKVCPQDASMHQNNEIMKQYPLSSSKLKQFLRDVRYNKNPVAFALGMLNEYKPDGTIMELCEQLIEYYYISDDIHVRNRLKRLVSSLSEGSKAVP